MRNLFHFHCLRCETKAALRTTFPSQGILLLFSCYFYWYYASEQNFPLNLQHDYVIFHIYTYMHTRAGHGWLSSNLKCISLQIEFKIYENLFPIKIVKLT